MRITISGPPGSGKTTVCMLLAQRLGAECLISGTVFREMAKESNLSLAEFGKLAENDPKYDRIVDESMLSRALALQNVVVEGRLTGHLLSKKDPSAFKVYLDAAPNARAERIKERENEDIQRIKDEMLERENCEARRYKQYYGIDINDKSVYDLVVDSSHRTPEQVVDLIMKKLEVWPRRA